MANVSHATLTGADLHEPKGVASASSGQVYVADGVGSGAWTAHSSFGGAFGNQLYHIRDVQSTGTAGQTYTSATWNTVRFNTEITDEITASLSSNQMTLPAGTYWVDALVSFSCNVGGEVARLRLRNITSGSDTLVGLQARHGAVNGGLFLTAATNLIPLRGRFTLAGSTTLAIQLYTNSGSCVGGYAQSLASYSEIYHEAMFWKIA